MIKLIFEGREYSYTLDEFKEDYNFHLDSYYKDIQKVEDDGNGNITIYYLDKIRCFKKYSMGTYLDLVDKSEDDLFK